MHWFLRKYRRAESYEADQTRFDALFHSLGAPPEMMMLWSGVAREATVHIALPARSWVEHFPGYEPSHEPAQVRGVLVCCEGPFVDAVRRRIRF